MKKLLFALCMITLSVSMFAQDKKQNWVTGEQESSFPGEMIQYAICQSKTEIKGLDDKQITVALNIMIFRGTCNYFLKSTGEDFKLDHLQTQHVLIQFDDQQATNYAIEGNNTYTSNTLKFSGSYKNKFKKLLKTGKKIRMDVEFADSGQKTIEFDIEGIDVSYIK